MNIMVLDNQFDRIYDVDVFESFLWADRYDEPGSFELYAPVTSDILEYCKPGYYLSNTESDRTMIIEDMTIETDMENGNKIKIIGRSLESILDRRIVWTQTTVSGSLQSCIQKLLNDAIINPSDEKRKIENFIFVESSDIEITTLMAEFQVTGDDLLTTIEDLCKKSELGFKITLEDGYFKFKLFKGTDRSYDSGNDVVVFSPSFDNLISTNYKEERSPYKNIALVAGEGEGLARKTAISGNSSVSGLDRREFYVDARDISKEDGMSTLQYTALLVTRGEEKLAEKTITKEFDGKCETSQLYSYNQDFFMGDILQIENEYGISAKSRITEFVWSHDSSGFESYPTFTAIND